MPLRGGGARGLAAVDAFAQLLARLEERHRLLVHRHRLAGARVAAGAGVAALDREGAEAAQLDALATRQGGGDLVEDGADDELDVAAEQMRVGRGQLGDQLGFRHEAPGG